MTSYRTKFLGSTASAIVAPNSTEPEIPRGLLEPLIPENQKDELECKDDNPWSGVGVIIVVFLLGAAGITVSAAAMVSETGAVVVYLAGGLCILNSAILIKNQYQISNGKTPAGYRHGINSLRKEATKFGEEYELLTQAVDELQREAHSKKQFEDRLSDIARRKNTKVDDIVMLVKENEEILSQQKAILKQIFLVDIAKAFFTSEFHTEDMKVDMEYLPILILRLRMQLESHGMRLDTDKLTNIIRQNNDVFSLLKIFGSMLLLETAGNFDYDEMGVVTLHEKYSRGSVDLARGKTPRLIETKNKQRDTFARDVKVWLNINGIMVSSPKKSHMSARDSTGANGGYSPVKTLREIKSKDIEARAKQASSSLGMQKKDDDYVMPANQMSQFKTKFNTSALMTVDASLRGSRTSVDGSINKSIIPHKGSVREDESVAQVSSSGKTSLLLSSQFILSRDDFSQSTGVLSRNSTESDESSSSTNSTRSAGDSTSEKSTGTAEKLSRTNSYRSADNSSSANSTGSADNSSSANSSRSADSSSRKSAAALVRSSKFILSHDDSSQSESSDVSNTSSTRSSNINPEKHRGSETDGRTLALQQKNKPGDKDTSMQGNSEARDSSPGQKNKG